ncbi:hypothetical protein AB6A40_000404 [Gnathostoma spinigerum]|uniref:Dynein heavy chain C-terminal domain-containing protein n=1 Tax=Gnathostoma spinigerum TaxID=75299 RepID=A0ABD6EBN1_9BILA
MLLDCLLQKLFTSKSFDADRVLIPNIDGATNLCIPDGNSREHLIMWTENMPQLQLPSWLGLPNNAEKVLLTVRGENMLANLLKVSDEELAFGGDDQKVESPPWMSILGEQSVQWLKLLPKSIPKLKRTADNIKDPLFRFFEREINLGINLLASIRGDLKEIHAVCRGEQKQNNHTRELTTALNKGQVPSDWVRYTVPKGVTVMGWIQDFAKRVNQLTKFAASNSLKKEPIWLGGMFSPEAYITATRQLVAQSNQWSLEELNMLIEVGLEEDKPDTFRIEGLRLLGAECKEKNTIRVVDEVSTEMNNVGISWAREPSSSSAINLPVYLYRDRKNLLFTLDFNPANVEKNVFYERSVAVTSNSALS